jgi:hypothetical protein
VLENLSGNPQAEVLARFYQPAEPALLERYRTRPRALRAFVASQMTAEAFPVIDPDLRAALIGLADELRAGGQGIVVAGSRADLVRITDNLVEDMTQGIHVAVSGTAAGSEAAEDVLLARNRVDALVPVQWARARHGIFVGNARSISILDTSATLRRIGRPPIVIRSIFTPVTAIQVFGVLGPYLLVRQSVLFGFQTGVHVTVIQPAPDPARRLWMVAETMIIKFRQGVGPAVVADNHPPPPPPLPAPVLTLANNVP